MHPLEWFLVSYEGRDPEETSPGSPPGADRDLPQRSVSVSLTVAVRESGTRKVFRARDVPAPGLSLPASEARAPDHGPFRRLRHVLRLGLTTIADSPHPASEQAPQPASAASQPPAPRVPGSAGGSFWGTLTLAEQEALRSVAVRREFRAGDRLMREGEQADHVMVIIEGRTRVCVDENGWERVLAERGPGELIGERSGLQVRARSASVIAQDAVRVLMVGTEDFTAFVNAHPRVFDIVECQLYHRLTQSAAETRERDEPAVNAVSADSTPPGTIRHTGVPAPYEAMQALWNGQNCTILYSDVVAFSSRDRNDGDRLAIRRALLEITLVALRGIPGAWSQDRGDGLLTVVPPSVPTADVIALLHKELPDALDRHNSAGRESTRFQLRVAVNVGPVTSDTIGVSGEAIIIAARLLDAPIFKNAIAQETAKLGIIASNFVYETVIRHSLNPIDLAGYSEVQAITKEFAIPAWMKLLCGLGPYPYYSPPGVTDWPGSRLGPRRGPGRVSCSAAGTTRSAGIRRPGRAAILSSQRSSSSAR
jgi:CRP-like cAMP-binding protein